MNASERLFKEEWRGYLCPLRTSLGPSGGCWRSIVSGVSVRICDEGVVEQLLEVARVVFGMSECPEVGGCPGGSARMSAAASALPPPPPPSLLLLLLLLLLCRYSLLRAFHKTQNEKLLRRVVLRDAWRVEKQQHSSSSTAAAQQQQQQQQQRWRRRRRRWRRCGSSSGQLSFGVSGWLLCCVSVAERVCSVGVCVFAVPRCLGCAVSASG